MTPDPRLSLAAAYAELGESGLIQGSAGNVSQRSAAGMLMSPTRTTPRTVTPAGLVDMPLDSTPDQARSLGASSEWHFHAALYQDRPDIGAIVHTHSDHCTALACLNEPLPAFHYMIMAFGGDDVRCGPYVTFGTPELAAICVTAMQGRTACLLANHGMITAGKDLPTAMDRAHLLEQLCRQYLIARGAGTPRILTAAEMALAHGRYKTY